MPRKDQRPGSSSPPAWPASSRATTARMTGYRGLDRRAGPVRRRPLRRRLRQRRLQHHVHQEWATTVTDSFVEYRREILRSLHAPRGYAHRFSHAVEAQLWIIEIHRHELAPLRGGSEILEHV